MVYGIVLCHLSFWEIVFAAGAEQRRKEYKYKECKKYQINIILQ